MKTISSDEVKRWQVEIGQAEKFRDDEFGKSLWNDKQKAGQNIDYYENGGYYESLDNLVLSGAIATINIIYPIVKNVIPTLYYKNPYVLSFPKRKNPEDEQAAPYAGALLNYYHKELELKSVNKQIVFDAYVIGMGVCKIGYTTKFGTAPTEESIEQEKKDREKDKKKGFLEALGLKKPKKKEKEVKNPDLNEFIRSESPWISWINPFEFLIDPRANCIEEAQWVGHKVRKKLSQVKKEYDNTDGLVGDVPREGLTNDIPETQLDEFQEVDLYEIHIKTDEGIDILTLAKQKSDYRELKYMESVYEMDGFQFEVMYFNKHNHKLYPKSDIDMIKGLQERINSTFEAILDQIEKFVPKLIVDETAMSEGGKKALKSGGIGAICYSNKNPAEVVKEASFTQLKADLLLFIDKMLEIVMLITGLTKAQLMGLTTAQTATEAQIGQAGQNLRLSDKFDNVNDFLNRQTRKFWQVIRQFVDMTQVSLITGEQAVDPQSGMAKYSWMPDITSNIAEKLATGEYRFDIEMGSTEKPDLPILRKQIENLVGVLGGEGTLQMIAQQGYRIELVEILREYLSLFPNMFKNPGRIIKPIQGPEQAGVMPPEQQGGGRPQAQPQGKPPNMADIISGIGGEKGQNVPIA